MSFDEMNKAQLRAACKAAGIPYGKLNNDGMRAALKALEAEAANDAEVEVDDQEQIEEETSQPAPAAQTEEPSAPTGPRPKVVGEVVQSKSLKIEKGRPRANGVTKPSAGSICRAIWDALDAHRAANEGVVPEFEDVRNLMKTNNWQRNTAFTQFQRWKQFHGVMPRDASEGDAE